MYYDGSVCLVLQLEQSLRGQGGESLEAPSKNLVQQNIELRRKLEDEHASYKRKLQAYQDGQQRQAQLVQKLQAKVNIVCTLLPYMVNIMCTLLPYVLISFYNKNIYSYSDFKVSEK